MEHRRSSAVLSLVDSICAKVLAPEPDQKLLQLFRENGDQHAFRALVERHQGAVLAVARRFVRQEDAEDVSQAVFLILVRKMRATEIVSLHSWLIGVAYRAIEEEAVPRIDETLAAPELKLRFGQIGYTRLENLTARRFPSWTARRTRPLLLLAFLISVCKRLQRRRNNIAVLDSMSRGRAGISGLTAVAVSAENCKRLVRR